jgi:hypothetical protein
MLAEKHISLQMNQFIYGMLDGAPSLAAGLREFLPSVIKLFFYKVKKRRKDTANLLSHIQLTFTLETKSSVAR